MQPLEDTHKNCKWNEIKLVKEHALLYARGTLNNSFNVHLTYLELDDSDIP